MMRILLAEDNALCRMACAEMLEASGATVTAVRDGAEAVAACRADVFDVALLDRYMDDVDGPAAAAMLHHIQPTMLLILLTAAPYGCIGDFDAVLPKPLRLDQLEHLLQNTITTRP